MALVHLYPLFSCLRFSLRATPASRRLPVVRVSLPLHNQKAKFHKELQVAAEVVEKACRVCVDVQKSLLASEGTIVEKGDQTLVTIADFAVQALVSLELSRHFPSIPLVAEEDSGYLRENNLVDAVVNVVNVNSFGNTNSLTESDVLSAIDRGGKRAVVHQEKPATYWILDPIDGTKGFVKGVSALYVVGLSLVFEEEIVVGAMGCPNWDASGIIMIAHTGFGSWIKSLSNKLNDSHSYHGWTRCFVDAKRSISEARFCIPDSQTWESLPLSASYLATNDSSSISEKEVFLLSACCGSLCKYLMVATGRASAFIQRARAEATVKVSFGMGSRSGRNMRGRGGRTGDRLGRKQA